jgi:hypothetical protein
MAWQKKQNREIAIGAVRSKMRSDGLYPERQTAKTALAVLDDISRVESEKRYAIWYKECTDNEITLFIRDWNLWRKKYIKENYIDKKAHI